MLKLLKILLRRDSMNVLSKYIQVVLGVFMFKGEEKERNVMLSMINIIKHGKKKEKHHHIVNNHHVQTRELHTVTQQKIVDSKKVSNLFGDGHKFKDIKKWIHPNVFFVDKDGKYWNFGLTHSSRPVNNEAVIYIKKGYYMTKPIETTRTEILLVLNQVNKIKLNKGLIDLIGEEHAINLMNVYNFETEINLHNIDFLQQID